MATLKKIVDELREELSGFRISDDTLLPDREYFIDKINSYRESAIRELEVIPEGMYTTSCCHEVVCKNHSCDLNGITYKSKTILHEVELPNLMDGVGVKDIIYLGLEGFSKKFIRVNLNQFLQPDISEYGNSFPIYVRVGNSILLKNLPVQSGNIRVQGLRFLCATYLASAPNDDCSYGEDVVYPASEYILNRVKRLVKMDVLQAMGYPKDFISDALPAMQIPSQESSDAERN